MVHKTFIHKYALYKSEDGMVGGPIHPSHHRCTTSPPTLLVSESTTEKFRHSQGFESGAIKERTGCAGGCVT